MKPFTGQFTQQEPIPKEAIDMAVNVLNSGRLHRYNTIINETSLTSELEVEYANFQGSRYCLACSSGGYAMSLAMRAAGINPGDQVLTNGFTLAPVPGAIASVHAKAILVEVREDLTIDLDDLQEKAKHGARALLLSNMRGHLGDMNEIVRICKEHDLILIEDCAHTMGAEWMGQKSGNFGLAGCFSTQTYKHMNSGEGGLLTSDDPEFMAKAILLSGSYMLFDRHKAAPESKYFNQVKLEAPNMSGRMDNLRAAILLPQLQDLYKNIIRWNDRYARISKQLEKSSVIKLPLRPDEEFYVGSSIQFNIPTFSMEDVQNFLNKTAELGVELKWFGDENPVGFTSKYSSWHYIEHQSLPNTDKILSTLFDMRIPLSFSLEDCEHIAQIIVHCAELVILERAE